MKLFVYGCRPDEVSSFERCAALYGVEIARTPVQPSPETAELARGAFAVSVVFTPIDAETIRLWHEAGVQVISSRTNGIDHVDLAAAKKYGMRVSNVGYSPDCVSDYAVMLLLMMLRRTRTILTKADVHDYSLPGCLGRNLRDCTVGIIGTGRIGRQVIRDLNGFGCRILAYNRTKIEGLEAEQVSLDILLAESDFISLHTPLTDATRHMFNDETFAKMKADAVLINTARGGLVDTQALIRALRNHVIGGAALDVLEEETGVFRRDRRGDSDFPAELSILKDMPNVIFSPHMAFYTEEAVFEMASASVKSSLAEFNGEENLWRIV